MIVSLSAKIIAHKLALLAIAATAADIGTTIAVQSRNAYLPPSGVFYVAADGRRYQSPGRVREIDPLLGPHPSAARISFTVPLDTIGALLASRRYPKASRDVLIYSAISHSAGAVSNLVAWPKVYPKPVCLVGPGCQPISVEAFREVKIK